MSDHKGRAISLLAALSDVTDVAARVEVTELYLQRAYEAGHKDGWLKGYERIRNAEARED